MYFLEGKETSRWREKLQKHKWEYVNEELANKKIISCTKVKQLKNTGEFL